MDGKDPGPGQGATISPTSTNLWATSLLEWGKRLGCYLRRGGNDMKGSACEFIRDSHCTLPPSTLKILESLDVTQFGDLTLEKDGAREWLPPRLIRRAGLDLTLPFITQRPIPLGPIPLRPGSC